MQGLFGFYAGKVIGKPFDDMDLLKKAPDRGRIQNHVSIHSCQIKSVASAAEK
jgi:hypothetical protein